MAAVEYAEHAQSPELRGNVLIRLSIDFLNGRIRVEYEYERGPDRPEAGPAGNASAHR
jgi:hypothetical protein